MKFKYYWVILCVFLFFSNFSFSQFDYYLPKDTADQFIEHSFYSLAYSFDYKQAKWLGYKLTYSMLLNKNANRKNKFKPDPKVKKGSAMNSDYLKSGYDKGHMCPAADMSFNQNAMDETFYLSNISPQNPKLNRGKWKDLEELTRKWISKTDTAYFIITGPIFSDTSKTIGLNKVVVPDFYFKIVFDFTLPEIKMIAFIMPNTFCSESIKNYIVSVDDIENVTGIDFFPLLDKNIQEKLESKSNLNMWVW